MQTIKTPDGQVFKFPDTMSRDQIAEALKRRLGNKSTQPSQQPVNGDTSMGTAFTSSDLRAQSLGPKGFATVNRALEDGIVGNTLNRITDNYINPMYEKLGIEPIDRRKNTQEFTANLEAAGDKASEAAQQFEENRGFQNLTTDNIKDIPSFVDYAQQKIAQAGAFMVPTLAMGPNPVTMTAIGYPFAVGESYENIEDLEGTLTQQQKDDYASLAGVVMSGLDAIGLSRLLPNGVSTSIIGGIADGAISEGVTEGLQELVQIGLEASAGKEFAEGEILKRLKESVAAGATVGSSIKTTSNTATKLKSLFTSDGNLVDPNRLDADQKQAAASVAQMLRQTANENGLNLKNVNASSSKGAKQALEDAHETISNQLKDITANKAVKGFLSPKNAKTLDELIDDYSAAAVALRQGKNKVKSKVMQKNYDAIMRLLPDSTEKTQIANLLKMSNQVTDLFNNGLKGGLSQYTDYFFPLAPSGAAYDPNRTASAAIGTVSAISTFGKTLAIPAAGRVVDFFTGRRSSVARFVKKNENKLGLAKPDGPSLIEKAEAKKATSKARRQAVAKIATILNAPKPGFVENILLGTGLDRNGLETVLNNMAADFASDPEFTSILNDIQSNLDAEGVEYLDVLSEIIPVIGAYAQANSPDLVTNTPDNPLLKREFEGPNVDPTGPAQPQGGDEFGPQFTTPQNYNRGIENNLQFNRELQDGATLDKSLSLVDRGRIVTSLENLTNNLGSSPVPTVQTEIQKLQDAGVSQEAIDTYVKPYADRVIGQQKRNTPKQPEDPTRFQMALPLFENPLPIEGKVTVKKIGEAMNQDHMEKVGRKLYPEQDDSDYGTVLDYAKQELAEQLKQPNSGVGWYSKDVDNSMKLASRVYPTLATNQEHRQLYLTFAGIFSNGADPDNAFMMSSMAFDDFLRTGEIPTNRAEGFRQQGLEPPKTTFKSAKTGKMVTKDAGWGIRDTSNQQQLGMLKYLVQREGSLKSAMEFLLTPQGRKDINDVMLDSGLYKAGRFTTKVELEGPPEYGFLAFGKKLGRYSLGLHGVEVDAGDTTIDLWYTRTYRRYTGRLLDTPIGKEGVAAQPASDQERDTIFRLTGDLVAENPDLTVGDVQALLWFFEKRTWGAQGLKTKEGTNSSGARKLLRERGIDPEQIDDGARGDGTGTQDSAAPEQPARFSAQQPLGVLSEADNNGPVQRSTPPSNEEVKQQYDLARAPLQINKPGSKFENGIKDLDGIKVLADAYGITLTAYTTPQAMAKDFNTKGSGSGLSGIYSPTRAAAGYLSAGATRRDKTKVTPNQSFITALHEVTHGVAGTFLPDGTRATEDNITPLNTLNNRREPLRPGTLEAKISEFLELKDAEKNEIVKELIKLQDEVNFVFNDGEVQAVRDLAQVNSFYEKQKPISSPSWARKWRPLIAKHAKYVRGTYEISVDPALFYFFDPKEFKKVAPKTAKMMRDFFNSAGKVQFFSHPLAMGAAVVLAMLMKQEQAEEEEQRRRMMPPPGALNQPMQPGALSA